MYVSPSVTHQIVQYGFARLMIIPYRIGWRVDDSDSGGEEILNDGTDLSSPAAIQLYTLVMKLLTITWDCAFSLTYASIDYLLLKIIVAMVKRIIIQI